MRPDLVRTWRERLPTHGYVDLADDLDDFPALRDAVCPPQFTLRVEERSCVAAEGDEDIVAELQGELLPPDGLPVAPDSRGWAHIELATADGVGVIHTLDIAEGIQAAGLGRLIIAQVAHLGDRLGLEALTLEAGKIGRWAWMRCGFDFMEADDRDRVIEAAQRFAARLGRPVDLSDVAHTWDFLRFDELVPAEEILRAGGPKIYPAGTSVALGKALLLGPAKHENPWFGRLTLNAQSEGRVRLESYVAQQ